MGVWRGAAAGFAIALTLPAVAAAAPARRLATGQSFEGLALAGGQAVYGVRGGSGFDQTLDVFVQPVAGGQARRVFHDRYRSFEQLNADVDHTANETVAASPQALAVSSSTAEETGVAASGTATLEFGPVGGARSEIEHCEDIDGEPTYDGAFIVGGTRLAYVSQCGANAGAVVVRDVSGAQRVLGTGGAVLYGIAGDELSYGANEGGVAVIHVVDLATGAPVTAVADHGLVAVQADGKLAVAGGNDCPHALRWYARGSTAPSALPGATPCTGLTMNGDRVLYRDRDLTLHAVDLAGADRALFPVAAYAAEGSQGVVETGGCAQDALYAIALDGSTTPPAVPATCPVRVASRRLRLRARRIHVRVSCPRGCVGSLALNRSRSPRASAVAEAPLSVIAPRTRATVTLRLSRADVRALGRLPRRTTLVVSAKPGPVASFRATRVPVTVRG
jgi:hypothetical protein